MSASTDGGLATPGEESTEEENGTESCETSHPDGSEMYRTVDDDYFADAVFIGDSRTVGMFEYGEYGGNG